MTADIRFEIPKGTGASECKGCSALIYWIKTKAGKNMPVDADGKPHWATCTQPDKFRKPHVVIIAPAKAMRDLRHPTNSKKLRSILENK